MTGSSIVPLRVFADADDLGEALAARILAGVERARAVGCPFLLGRPGGRSLSPTYRALTRAAAGASTVRRPWSR